MESVVDTGIHTEIQVLVTEDHLVLLPLASTRPETHKVAIVFDRNTQQLATEAVGPAVEKYSLVKQAADPTIAFGVLGILTLHSSLYIILVKKRSLVGLIDGQCIYKVAEPAIFRISNKGGRDFRDDMTTPGAKNGEASNRKRDEIYMALKCVRMLLKSKDFYFSYNYDISNTLMRKHQQPDSLNSKPLWMRWEDRFFCNRVISSQLIDNKLHEWILPSMRGIVQIFVVVVQKQPFEFFLVSRRSRHRVGTRYKTRGVDSQGNVANYVETEQIVSINGHWMSFVQLRGSIPLLWEQSGLKYTPVPKISPDVQANAAYFAKHFSTQIGLYQRQVVVNLVDQKGVESDLGSMYEDFCNKAIKNMEDMAIFCFDFHDKCKTSYDNVSELIRNLSPELERMGLFHRDANGRVVSTQVGTVRTNCMDCLDRTNLVQSFVGRFFAMKMLRAFNVAWDEKENIILEKIFKEAWASNGDAISIQYAGTGALKADFTRTGKRQTKGVLKDAQNSLSRYWINIFRDSLRQAAIDLFYGTQSGTLEDDVLQQRGLWNKAQYTAIEECTAHLEESGELAEDEVITHAWIIVSINEMDVEQERVLVLTNKYLVRFKYNFNTSKIARFKRLPLNDIVSAQLGPFANKPNQFGFSLFFASSENKGQSAHIYFPLDASRNSTNKTLNAIADAVREFTPGMPLEEKTITRRSTVRGAVLNKFKLGMFNGRSKTKSSQASNVSQTGGTSSSTGTTSTVNTSGAKDSSPRSAVSGSTGASATSSTTSPASTRMDTSKNGNTAEVAMDGDEDDFELMEDEPAASQFEDDGSDNEF